MSEGACRFPEAFGWGTATASYQIEGAVDVAGRSPSIWDTFSHRRGAIADATTGDTACEHYHRWAEDVALMADLGIRYYRFSLAWPRLQPTGRGGLNRAGVDFYARLVDALHERGITPWATLYHWDLPQVLEDAGGWPVRDTASRFADYAERVHNALGDRIRYWTTLNEPFCSSMLGYGSGAHAPGRTEPDAAIRAAHHLLLGHGLALQAMRGGDHDFGITLNLSPIEAASEAPHDTDVARRVDGMTNRFFLDPLLRGRYPDDLLGDLGPLTDFGHVRDGDLATIAQPLDLLGVNYYRRRVLRAGERDRFSRTAHVGAGDAEFVTRGLPRTAMGWEVDPDGLHAILTRVWREYSPPPLWITENGAAYHDVVGADERIHDAERIDYLDRHLRAAHRAIADGVDLRGYFAWTLLDNFEWAHGLSRRFGLVHVDYDTQRRTPKDSAGWFGAVIAANGLPARPAG